MHFVKGLCGVDSVFLFVLGGDMSVECGSAVSTYRVRVMVGQLWKDPLGR